MFRMASNRGGFISCPISFFRDFSRSYERIIAKSSVPSKLSIRHILKKGKLGSFDMSVINDVRVTSYFPGFRQKQGFMGNAVTQTAKKVELISFQKKVEN